MIVLDAAILMEAGWHTVCDKILFIDSAPEIRRQRLAKQRGWSGREMDQREDAQMPLAEKRRRADAVIANDAEPEQIAAQVQSLLERWKL